MKIKPDILQAATTRICKEAVMEKEYPPVIGVPEAAEILGICTKEVYNLAHRADFFPAFRIGSRIRISYARLLEWVDIQTR